MRVYPIAEDDSIYLETDLNLKMSERAAVTTIFKKYNLEVDNIKKENQRNLAKRENEKVLGRCKFYGITKFVDNNIEQDLDNIKVVDVKKEKAESQRLQIATETSLNFKDIF